MEYFDLVSLHLGRLIICISVSLIAMALVLFLHDWFFQCTRYASLILRADRFHGDVITETWKKKRFWKMRFVWRVFFREGLFLVNMGKNDNIQNSDRWFFSREKTYVVGKRC